ncbi:molybdopterin-dependent oxidoreductase [Aminobacter aminovorans]|nr:molybdopterin-dependent oxidoreductase [Aminobacter aminovorans]AMS45483.1 Molybdopterin oxidoreductase [Aminobacter aminovorans]
MGHGDNGQGGRDNGFLLHSSHWGVFSARWDGEKLSVQPYAGDPDPNQIIENFPEALRHSARIKRPCIRRGWLENGPGPDLRRGTDDYVEVSWKEAIRLAGNELLRIRTDFGPAAMFGGSYGWSSAGRFHHAQSQVHRFLNLAMGGYIRSVNSYSAGASSVIIPHIIGNFENHTKRNVSWAQIETETDIVVAFGGMALKNSMVSGGGISEHVERGAMERAHKRGCRFILIGPIQDDLPAEAGAEWVPVIPGTDTALMLGLIHTLVSTGLHDQPFLARYTTGWDRFEAYVMGRVDGLPKDAAWASGITGVAAKTIIELANALHGRRSLITVAHALQRAEHGEQPVWMGAALAAALGQMGLPGGGYAYALGAIGYYGRRNNAVPMPTFPQERNPIQEFIPVARIADMLLNPGSSYRYNGETRSYPRVRAMYWAGGNPFHHHQDLARLRKAFGQVDTLIVNEMAWTGTARHADIVLPCTMTLEREDIGGSSNDPLLVPMRRVAPPLGEARDDYDIFSELAGHLGAREAFTEGRTTRQWLEHLYERTRGALVSLDQPAPDFEEFWQGDGLRLPQEPDDGGQLRAFRADPSSHPLPTPSGRIEIFSETIESFGERDCPGHPVWLPPQEAPKADAPLYLVANQPATRLHSQLDFGGHSARSKRQGREVARMHPADAAERSIADGDIVRLFNQRGACLASVRLDERLRKGVVQIPTGAWFDPLDLNAESVLCVHGNPNVLTRDVGTSALAQGCSGQLTIIEIERFDGILPDIRAYDPPVGRPAR